MAGGQWLVKEQRLLLCTSHQPLTASHFDSSVSHRPNRQESPTRRLRRVIGCGKQLGLGTFSGALIFCILGLSLAGLSYGPLGTALAGLFPTPVRYTGISLTFNLAGILGASLTPYIATWLATNHGLPAVGYYLSAVSLLTLIALLWLASDDYASRAQKDGQNISG